jgi:hypothetical protein
VDHADADVQPAAHPARVGLARPIARVGEVERVEDLLGPDRGRGFAHTKEAGLDDQLLAAGGRAVGAAGLGHVADLLAHFVGLAGDVEAGNPGRPGRRRQERGEDPKRRRLAGAVRSQEAEDLPGLDLEVDTRHGFHCPGLLAVPLEGLPKSVRFDDGLTAHREPPAVSNWFVVNVIVLPLGFTVAPPAPATGLSGLVLPESQDRGWTCAVRLLRYTVAAQRRE